MSIVARNNRFELYHRVDGKTHYFGSYTSLDDVKEAESFFERMGWNVCLKESSDESMKYIYPSRDKWVICKDNKYISIHNDLESAKVERDLLVSFNWDLDEFYDFVCYE